MKVIGLTGGIASGKSTASAYLAQLGATVVDADAVSRDVTKKGGPGFHAVVQHFGTGVLGDDGAIDRKRLGALIFSDDRAREQLNALLHPIIIAQCEQRIRDAKDAGSTRCILDVPLLFETGMHTLCDETWLMHIPRAEQVRRIMQRDGLDERAANARIDSQMPLEEKLALAGRAIDASGDIENTRKLIKQLWEETT